MTEDLHKKTTSCGVCQGFNYCFWAKFIVGIPALGICGYIAAMQFSTPLLQSVAWIATVMFMVWAAITIDHMPMMQKKIMVCKKKSD